jgi:iron(III) transport system permease protein
MMTGSGAPAAGAHASPRWSPSGETVLIAVLSAVVLLLAVIPAVRLAAVGLMPEGSFELTALTRVLAAPATWTALEHTLATAAAGTVISLLLGGGAALLVSLTDIRFRGAMVFAFMLPLMIPAQVVAIAWIELCGPASPLLRPLGLAPPAGTPHPLYGFGGISLLLGVEHAPLVFLALRAGLRSLPREALEAAQAAGAGPWRRLATIILPMSLPAVTAGAALAFVSCIGNFGTPALLGIPGGYNVLTVLIYQKLAGFGPRVLPEVAALSLLLGIAAAIGVAAQEAINRRANARTLSTGARLAPVPLGRWRLPTEAAAWLLIGLLVVMPLAALLATSLVGAYGVPLGWGTATLDNYRYVLFQHAATARAFRNSFGLAAASAVLLAPVSIGLAYLVTRYSQDRIVRFLNRVAELPYAVPGTVLSIACILVFLKPLPLLGITLYDTPWIILFAYVARFFTLALRPAVAGCLQTDPAYEEAARMSGAGFARRLLTIVAPLVAPAASAGALLVFLVAFNELTVSALLWSSGNETLGVVVFGLEQAGDNAPAAALAMLTVLVTLALMALATVAGRRLPEGVLPWRV